MLKLFIFLGRNTENRIMILKKNDFFKKNLIDFFLLTIFLLLIEKTGEIT